MWGCPKLGDSDGQFNGKMRAEAVSFVVQEPPKTMQTGFNLPLKYQLVFVYAAVVWGQKPKLYKGQISQRQNKETNNAKARWNKRSREVEQERNKETRKGRNQENQEKTFLQATKG